MSTALPAPASSKTSSTSYEQRHGRFTVAGAKAYLSENVNPDLSTYPLAAYCFMTGYIDILSFSAIFLWCGFQTGNSAQLAIALARLFQTQPDGSHDTSFRLPDRFALCSLLSFVAGAFVGRVGDKMGAKTRGWLALGTALQALMTMAASVAIWKSGQLSISNERDLPAWSDVDAFVCVAFMSASLGLQGIMGKRVNTQFATTIVLTTVWCELMADPKLFQFRCMVITRDHKLFAVFALFLGAFVGRAILQSTSAAVTLGIGTGIRLLIALSWLFVPAKTAPTKTDGAKPGSKAGA
ncbi:hypothetical protein PUNSTDRAFT_52572 [Punctularia strigosozonata HHB-11173 SS5]|uniref:uncharacterized protein n=1 Tax=Punctularia strigosozonata (strain HHB-11173) TaxID=741275 RepID=UPI0004417CD3|nr:uncharacterized protein PUNSTDRAFT_52572 [Punctularia strigosozonata HHB-11173 SS5]EIN09300.1 hypothetical protein PUNSTDRAFT_52572 [Punctularia strigosozonata HHB-11173 SS5]